MFKRFIPITLLALLMVSVFSCKQTNQTNQTTGLVNNIEEFKAAIASLKPGDVITLANGVWKDAELDFVGKGTKEAPIKLTVETKGKVTLEGQSNIRIAGEHVIVEGLVFRNGYTPTKEVISLKKSKKELCNNCRVTECVIDNYNNPERFDSDYWVGIYGKNNRFDHNYLTGKRNHGVTLAVRLTTKESQENNHIIDHNYFGHRPTLGSNGGETMRIGTSHHSLTNSNTTVESNYFDRCSGELEIVSSKSCQNIYKYNTFNECKGTLTMRHGNETLVESNYFFGNGKTNTGGIRVINETQKVINNYCEGLTGYRFRGSLVIMNGVPNSPPNRYFQVIDSEVSSNSFINCDHVQLCAGSDEERSATPFNTKVNDNLFYNEKRDGLFTVYDDISGIAFNNNLTSPNVKSIAPSGFTGQKVDFKRNEAGLLMPTDNSIKTGFKPTGKMATPDNTGVSWYPRREDEIFFNTGKVIAVAPGENTLIEAYKKSQTGDILELAAGDYLMTKSIKVTHPITVRSSAAQKPKLQFELNSLFNIENGGALSLKNVQIDGAESPDAGGNNVIRTSRYSMERNYKLLIEDCAFTNLDINHSFDVLEVYKNTFADSIMLKNCQFDKVTGNVLSLNKETDDIGRYNAEYVIIENCQFDQIGGVVLNLHRGGRDESTFGPILFMQNNKLTDIGKDKRNKADASVTLHGVQYAIFDNNQFKDTEPMKLHLVVGEPITKIMNSSYENAGKIQSNSKEYVTENLTFK